MREFVYFSRNAWTSGNFDNLMKAGRLDIACHIVVMSFFISNAHRNNIRLHLFFYGPPDPPKHLIIESGDQGLDASVSKKDVGGLLKRMLYKNPTEDGSVEAFPGCHVDRQSMISFIEEKAEEGRDVLLLDPKGDDIRNVDIDDNPIFIMADQKGFTKAQLRRLKKSTKPVSLGKMTYFASQAMTIVQNELDNRGIF